MFSYHCCWAVITTIWSKSWILLSVLSFFLPQKTLEEMFAIKSAKARLLLTITEHARKTDMVRCWMFITTKVQLTLTFPGVFLRMICTLFPQKYYLFAESSGWKLGLYHSVPFSESFPPSAPPLQSELPFELGCNSETFWPWHVILALTQTERSVQKFNVLP